MARFDNLGEAIRTLREDRRWKQVKLAERAGISAAMLSKYERGSNTPSLATLGKILDALDIHFGAFDDRLRLLNERPASIQAHLYPATPDGVDLERFLGYSRLPFDLLPAFAEMVAGFQVIARGMVTRVLAERECSG